MKSDVGQKKRQQTEFDAEYAATLRESAMGGGEAVLGRAYELGRRAIAERKSLLELVSVHHRVLKELFQNSADRRSQGHLVQISCDFLSECVSPYEMAQRGFQDAVKALRQLTGVVRVAGLACYRVERSRHLGGVDHLGDRQPEYSNDRGIACLADDLRPERSQYLR